MTSMETQVKSLCDIFSKYAVLSGTVNETNIDHAVPVMRALLKDMFTGDDWRKHRTEFLAERFTVSEFLDCAMDVLRIELLTAQGKPLYPGEFDD